VEQLTMLKALIGNRARFIGLIIKKKLLINNRKKADIVKDLTKLRFDKFGDRDAPRTGFEYLLVMQILSLTKERKEELERLLAEKTKELAKLLKTSPSDMWSHDLDALDRALEEQNAQDAKEAGAAATGKKKNFKPSKRGKKRGAKDADEEGEGAGGENGGGDDEAAPAVADLDNPFSDMGRWMSAATSFAKKSRKS